MFFLDQSLIFPINNSRPVARGNAPSLKAWRATPTDTAVLCEKQTGGFTSRIWHYIAYRSHVQYMHVWFCMSLYVRLLYIYADKHIMYHWIIWTTLILGLLKTLGRLKLLKLKLVVHVCESGFRTLGHCHNKMATMTTTGQQWDDAT